MSTQHCQQRVSTERIIAHENRPEQTLTRSLFFGRKLNLTRQERRGRQSQHFCTDIFDKFRIELFELTKQNAC